MELSVWTIGLLLRILNYILAPLFWLRGRDRRRLPPVRDDLLLRSASNLAAAIRKGELTSERVVTAFIGRAKEVNPLLNAVVDERYEAAIEDARALDRQLADARKDGTVDLLLKDKPLYGVPFTVKQSCSLAGLSNAVGCLDHAGSRATVDGTTVRLVKEAGAIPLLVSNTPELCLGWETTNLLNGTTNNPYNLGRTPGGSSGGESALLACGASPFSVSSDIAGSIRIPAAFCGVFGHKATPNIVPIKGHIPTLEDKMYPKFLTMGPMSRHAEDLHLLMNIMAGENKDILMLDKPVDLSKIKVHYMTEASKALALIETEECIGDAILKAVSYLQRECGAQICEKKFKELEDSVEMSVSTFFAMKDIPNMLQDPANPKRDKSLVLEVLKHLVGAASRSLQGLGFALIHRTRLFMSSTTRERYRRKAEEFRVEITKTLGADGVLLYPVHCGVAHEHGRVFAKAAGVLYTMPLNVLGLPSTVVPMGLHRGLPVALQVVAGPHMDRLCIAVAKQLELGFGGWHPPL